MTYAYPTWEFAAGVHLLKLQCLSDKGLDIAKRIFQGVLVHVC